MKLHNDPCSGSHCAINVKPTATNLIQHNLPTNAPPGADTQYPGYNRGMNNTQAMPGTEIYPGQGITENQYVLKGMCECEEDCECECDVCNCDGEWSLDLEEEQCPCGGNCSCMEEQDEE